MKMEFFLTPIREGEEHSRPLDLLRNGQIAAAVAAASEPRWSSKVTDSGDQGLMPF
jgi:hypothetical protein